VSFFMLSWNHAMYDFHACFLTYVWYVCAWFQIFFRNIYNFIFTNYTLFNTFNI